MSFCGGKGDGMNMVLVFFLEKDVYLCLYFYDVDIVLFFGEWIFKVEK